MESPVHPHELKRILDFHEQPTRHHERTHALIKWKDRPEEGSTWEKISVLTKRFLTFVFADENSSIRGGVMSRQGSYKDKILGKSLTV